MGFFVEYYFENPDRSGKSSEAFPICGEVDSKALALEEIAKHMVRVGLPEPKWNTEGPLIRWNGLHGLYELPDPDYEEAVHRWRVVSVSN